MEVIEVTEREVEVIEVIERGPQGPAGAGITTLTTKGDLLYRGDTTGERLPIGTSGQILKVSATGIPEWGAAPSSGVSSVSGTAPIVSSGGATPAISITAATTSAAGSMSAADKTKLDGIASGAEVNVNADWNAGSGDAQILNKPTIPSASSSTPQALGTAAAGTSSNYSRADHVHAMPSAADVGAAPATINDIAADKAFELYDLPNDATALKIWDDEVTIRTAAKAPFRTALGLGTAATADIGTGAGDVCAGNDPRLSDPRDPNAHAASHYLDGGDDVIIENLATDQNNAGWILTASGSQGNSQGSKYSLAFERAARAAGKLYQSDDIDAENVVMGCDATGIWTVGSPENFRTAIELGAAATADIGTGSTEVAAGDHGHGNITNGGLVGTTSGLPLKTGTGGIVEAGAFGTTSGTFAAGDDSRITGAAQKSANLSDLASASTARTNLGLGTAAVEAASSFAASSHSHGNLTSDGKVGSVSGLPVVTTTSGAVTTLALGTANQVLRVNSGATGVEFGTVSSGDTVSIDSTASDILFATSGAISADDLGADKLWGWDDSAGKAIGFTLGTGLSTDGATLNVSGVGTKTYAVFSAYNDSMPPSSNYATLDTRNNIGVADFDDATDESLFFMGVIPEGASLASGLKIRLHWMATTATSGNCVWDVSLERMTTDLDSDSFDTIASATAAANGTSGILTVTEITLTTIDSVTAGDGFRLKVTRDANNGSDTMTGDAELVVCEVRSAA